MLLISCLTSNLVTTRLRISSTLVGEFDSLGGLLALEASVPKHAYHVFTRLKGVCSFQLVDNIREGAKARAHIIRCADCVIETVEGL